MENRFALHGDIVYSQTPERIDTMPCGYLVCDEEKVKGIFKTLPAEYAQIKIYDYQNKLILPGLVDLHLHAPQFSFRGLGMDLELLPWLETQTFPEEAKYGEVTYAERAYRMFVDNMKQSATTRAVIFATVHVPATLLLMNMLEESGLCTFVGKVNMDRNASVALNEANAGASLSATREWLSACEGRYWRTGPILTPRFIPSCSDALMQGLAALQKQTGLPVQSHLSENPSEVAWVKELCPESESYADAYRRFGLLGGADCPTIMAHCVYVSDAEMELLHRQGVYVAHCPNSNMNLSSGIAPARQYLDAGLRVGLGTDVAGGFSTSVFRAMSDAIQCSKLRWRLKDDGIPPLTLAQAFYMGTKGGGAFFGKVGSFENEYDFDAVIIDDANLPCPYELTLAQRLERVVYLSDGSNIKAKFVKGRKIL